MERFEQVQLLGKSELHTRRGLYCAFRSQYISLHTDKTLWKP